MGEAALKREYESKKCQFDFNAIKTAMSEGDIKQFGGVVARVAINKVTIQTIVNTAKPKMKLEDADHWEIWQEIIAADNTESVVDMTMGEVAWLRKLIEKDDIEWPTPYIQWIRSLLRYLKSVEPNVSPNVEEVKI